MKKYLAGLLMVVLALLAIINFNFLKGEDNLSEFCGSSTYAMCTKDSDCHTTGCSGEVCSSETEGKITGCIWYPCFEAKNYGMKCACDENKCQWTKSFLLKLQKYT